MVDTFTTLFEGLKKKGRAAYVPYITASYPTKDDTVPILLALQEAGADIIEVGVPFSDPIADGPTIQKANFDALKTGVRLPDVFNLVEAAREKGLTVPIVLMGYLNPFYAFGAVKLTAECKRVGVQGLIIVDLPLDEEPEFVAPLVEGGVALVPLIAPTSTEERMESLAKSSAGYVYCVSVTGITGNRKDLPPYLAEFVGRVRKHFSLPLVVGFGLHTADHVKGVSAVAEGVVMGTSIIKAVAAGGDTVEGRVASVSKFVHSVLDPVRSE